MMDVDLHQLPMPDWDLCCPTCAYPLRRLPTPRCPECGRELDIPEIAQPWNRLREPEFDGTELPVPDFGLRCTACGEPLAGATTYSCPHCAAGFDLRERRPGKPWFLVDHGLCGELPVSGVRTVLTHAYVPHYVRSEKSLGELYGGQSVLPTRLSVASDFYFDTLWLIQRARAEFEAAQRGDFATWECPTCGEENPGNFELCWNCGASSG